MTACRSLTTSFLCLLVTAAAMLLPTAAFAAPTERVTSGSKVTDAQYQSHLTSLVALVYTSAANQYEGQFCAGTLIDERHVLTAGHCFVDDAGLRTRPAPTAIAVLPGTTSLDDTSLIRSQLVPVQSIFVNPFFNIRTMRWDAAVLRLAQPITTIAPMPRLTDAEVASLGMGSSEVQGLVAGWGDTNPNSDDCCFPTQLKSANVPIHANDRCTRNLENTSEVLFDTEFQFCAGRLGTGGQLGADTCQGDSGGPLIVDIAGTPRHAGVTSFGVGCGQRFFGVYARTTALAAWLDSIPGIPAGDTRSELNGPGDLAAPSATGGPSGYRAVRIRITPATTGNAATAYTVWAREGTGTKATDIYLGKRTRTDFILPAPATNRFANYTLLVRPVGPFGEGPADIVRTRPLVDRIRPTIPGAVRVTRSGSRVLVTWRASIDRHSGTYGYYVQRRIGGRWRVPKLVRGRSMRFNAGRTSGQVRVLAEDWADNRSAWSAPVAY